MSLWSTVKETGATLLGLAASPITYLQYRANVENPTWEEFTKVWTLRNQMFADGEVGNPIENGRDLLVGSGGVVKDVVAGAEKLVKSPKFLLLAAGVVAVVIFAKRK